MIYNDQINLDKYYSTEQVLKLLNKTLVQLQGLKNRKKFPKPIQVKCKTNRRWVRPTRSYYDKERVHNWLTKMEMLDNINRGFNSDLEHLD